HRLGGAPDFACREAPGRPRFRAPAAARDAPRRGVSPRRRHALPHRRHDRSAAGGADRAHRNAVLPLALRPRKKELVMPAESKNLVALRVESLAFGFPGRTIGRDVSFSLAAGEAMCVLGPNGGGKTTPLPTMPRA